MQTGRCGLLQMLEVTKQSSYNNAREAAERRQTQSEAGHYLLVPHRFRQSRLSRAQHHRQEIEKVIHALVAQSLSDAQFLKKLDRFGRALEHAAATISVFSKSQQFPVSQLAVMTRQRLLGD